MPHISLIGLSYKTAPIAIREQLSCVVADVPSAALTATSRFEGLREVVVLSTCNRVELYAAFENAGDHAGAMGSLLSEITGVETAVFLPNTYQHNDKAAANHLFRVAAGLESLVLGEPQILGQVTHAYTAAIAGKTIGDTLDALFRAAIRVGKRARAETAVSRNPMSTSSLAIAHAEKRLDGLRDKHILIVGLGEMGRLALKRLEARGVKQITLTNRTDRRAAALAAEHGVAHRPFADLQHAIAQADVVISATSSPQIVLTGAMVSGAMAGRTRPLILLDIAVPRDIDPATRTIPHVELTDADELQSSLDEAFAARQNEVPKIEEIIAQEQTLLTAKLRINSVKPVIIGLRGRADRIRQNELERIFPNLDALDPETQKQLQYFSRALVNKLLHEPTVRLKEHAADAQTAVYADALTDLFDL